MPKIRVECILYLLKIPSFSMYQREPGQRWRNVLIYNNNNDKLNIAWIFSCINKCLKSIVNL